MVVHSLLHGCAEGFTVEFTASPLQGVLAQLVTGATAMASDDVEISTLVPEGEWTDESLAVLVADYEHKIAEMGATQSQIKTHVEHTSRGGVKIRVVWDRNGTP